MTPNPRTRLSRPPSEYTEFRALCHRCWKPLSTCYCAALVPCTPKMRFVILIHPLEARRGIATGRMAHLSLTTSLLFRGVDFSAHEAVNDLIRDPSSHCVILYPGRDSLCLSTLAAERRGEVFPVDKTLTVFVLDGTWHTAKKMRRQSTNLQTLPLVSFVPAAPSRFRIRKQPRQYCYSTLEAIHHVITLLEGGPGPQDQMLSTFDWMVRRQMHYMAHNRVDHPALRGFEAPTESLPVGRPRHGAGPVI